MLTEISIYVSTTKTWKFLIKKGFEINDLAKF